MPKFLFKCPEHDVFQVTLKQGDHQYADCPSCKQESERVIEEFGMTFQVGKVPGNSGVTSIDYPTADMAVGASSEVRWDEINRREDVKGKLRKMAGSRPLVRINTSQDGKPAIDYVAPGDKVIQIRKKVIADFNKITSSGK